ncbi:MAG: TVP38/TMEM64 family protein [Magnetospiraceae bacterium]
MKIRLGYLLRGLGVLLTFVAAGLILRFTGIADFLTEDWVATHIKGQGVMGELIFLAVAIPFTAFGLPRQVISFLGGFAFGFFQGTLLSVIATTGGCTIAFFYARAMGRKVIQARAPRRMKRIDDFLSERTFMMTVLIRLLPVGNNLLTNLAAGVSKAKAPPFIGGSAIGYIPQTAVFALAGSGVNLDPEWRIGLSVLLFVGSALLGVYLYRTYRHGKRLGHDVEEALGEEDAATAPPPETPKP